MTSPTPFEQAKQHHHVGRFAEAEALYRQAIALDSQNADALHFLGVLAFQSGRRDEALKLIRQAIQIDPRRAEFHANLGLVLSDIDPQQAIAAFQQAIAIQPNFPAALKNLGTFLGDLGRLDESHAIFDQALKLGVDVVDRLNQLALSMRSIARLKESLEIYDRILSVRPDHATIHGDRCYLIQILPEYDAPAILREHLEWNRRHAQPLAGEIRPHSNDRNPDRRLRIGYVSPDFKYHCQQLFTVPLFSRHDHSQFEIFCYARVSEPDEITEEFRRQYADVWRDTLNQSDEQVARQIRQDQIDILVDLTMHMPGGRPLLFARKPAPVQITWLAYPGTTGMPAIDYRLTDPYLDPPGQTDAFYAEKSIRLPHTFWCYDPRTPGPQVNPLPALTAGHITFGCLNSFCKVNDQVLELWSQVLKRLPTSHLILYLSNLEHRKKIPPRLDVDPSRVEFVPLQTRNDYLKTYHRIDLGLDTIPYNGHTTSLDSFWMGVPVVTLVGKTVVGRAGWSQLNNLNLKELAAFNDSDFVRIAVDLAQDLPRLAALRATLRPRMEKSPLMDAPLFARGLEATYRHLWRQWCQRS